MDRSFGHGFCGGRALPAVLNPHTTCPHFPFPLHLFLTILQEGQDHTAMGLYIPT